MTTVQINLRPSRPETIRAVDIPVGTYFTGRVGYASAIVRHEGVFVRFGFGVVRLDDPRWYWINVELHAVAVENYHPLQGVRIEEV